MLRGTSREAAAEFLGIFIFILILIVFGCASVAPAVLSGGDVGNAMSIHLSWGLAVTMAVYHGGLLWRPRSPARSSPPRSCTGCTPTPWPTSTAGRGRCLANDQSLLFFLHGIISVDNIGGAVAGAINGDGFPDWLAGTFYDRARNVGIVRLYSGAPKGVKAFGLGCKDPRGVVSRIGATRSPKIGTTFQINLCDTLPGNLALLLIGVSDKSWGNRSLPLDLGGLVGLPGCMLRVSPDVVLAVRTQGPTRPKAKGRGHRATGDSPGRDATRHSRLRPVAGVRRCGQGRCHPGRSR